MDSLRHLRHCIDCFPFQASQHRILHILMAFHSRYQFANAVPVHVDPLVFAVAPPPADTYHGALELHVVVKRNWCILYLAYEDARITVRNISQV